MKELLSVIAVWLSVSFGLPHVQDHPSVRTLSPQGLSAIRYGPVDVTRRREVLALYDDRKRTIFLSDGWVSHDPADVSILVHEMVHHLQSEAGLTFPCPAARERLAYEAQSRWLALFGLTLEAEFGIDAMTLKVSSGCIR
ncbi:MAG TPA: DUF6647 family protein [Aestuariivirgaceae bacterium]|nr:DUF6647 family protein [Aestuariivirgaceae bacterium]